MNGSWMRFASFLEEKGLPRGALLVGLITAFELVGGVLLALGRWTRPLSAGFIGMLAIGIVLIHAQLGWFVGEHGTGGSEYSVVLMLALVVVAAAADGDDARRLRVGVATVASPAREPRSARPQP